MPVCLVAQSCLTLCDPRTVACPWNSPCKNTKKERKKEREGGKGRKRKRKLKKKKKKPLVFLLSHCLLLPIPYSLKKKKKKKLEGVVEVVKPGCPGSKMRILFSGLGG